MLGCESLERTEHFEWTSLEGRPLIIDATPILLSNPSSSSSSCLHTLGSFGLVINLSIKRASLALHTYYIFCTFVVGFFFNDTTSGVCLHLCTFSLMDF
jgi:hypothetical protein